MISAFPHQFLVDLTLMGKEVNLPTYLRELIRQRDIADFEKFEEFLTQELSNAPLQSQQTVDYFLFLANQGLQYYFYRTDHEGFGHSLEILKHRLVSLRNVQQAHVNTKGWQQYLELAETAFLRTLRHISIEAYEAKIDELDWSLFDKTLIAYVSRLIGYVYLNEEEEEQCGKSRLWLQKSIHESDFEHNLANHLFMAGYYLKHANADNVARLNKIVNHLRAGMDKLSEAGLGIYFSSSVFELETLILNKQFAHFDDNLTRLEFCQQQIREVESAFNKQKNLPAYSQTVILNAIARLYEQLYHMTNDDLEQASFAKYAQRYIDRAIELAEQTHDQVNLMLLRLEKGEIAVSTQSQLTEKETKEVVQFFKKSASYPLYIRAINNYIKLLQRNDTANKTYDLLTDVFKLGSKRMEQGGFYLICCGLRLANDVFLEETEKPGVSWMIHLLDSFFERLKKVIDSMDEYIPRVGKSLIETFRSEFIRFEPVSHFNIKTYFIYQLYEIKMMRIGAMLYGDQHSLTLANKLIAELDNPNNPLHFIHADWEEFKKVPNTVRNNTLNKCISISKGDLPLAAEHLDFSYRNLRSYITFKEVNRLGFFLDLQQTDNKQLEQGIRYMFYDLYKRGTIFEVVFDMPKFLVKYAKKGFYSQDLERELNIKGTTAKKYIKIMMEIKLIRQDKTTGRKHYYRLIRENIMNRLGKDLNTLIEPQQEY
ncbi:MAG: hypothetical protein D6730_00750 [Bacteroidetes bacterium]|nr:MAG: hypothetical protein D6730_00750 [Bacteroidota bacterium]